MILLDTNVLVYALNKDAPQHRECRDVFDRTARGRLPGIVLPQVMLECYAVITKESGRLQSLQRG